MTVLAGFLFFLQINRSKQITINQTPTALISENATFIPPSDSDLILGNPGAPITIVEFMDFNCKDCLSFHMTIKEAVVKYPQQMRLIWKDAPQPRLLFKDASLTHQAGWCVAKQDQKKFWQFVDTVGTGNISESTLKKIIQGMNLNMAAWETCLQSDQTKQAVAAGTELAKNLGIPSLPAIFINNKAINIEADINLREMLESFIKK